MKEAYYTILTQAVQMLGGLLVFKILTSNLNSSMFGGYALVLSFSAIIFTFPFTAIQQALTKYASVAVNNRSLSIFKTIFIIDIVFFIVYCIFSSVLLLFNIIKIDFFSYMIIAFYIMTEVLKINNYTFANALRKRKKYFNAISLEFIIKLTFLFFYNDSINTVFSIFIIANIISTIYSKPDNIFSNSLNKIQFYYWIKMIYIFALPLAIWGVFGWLRDMSNRWVIDYFLTLDEVALFSVMNTLTVIVPGALQAFFGMYFMPILYQKEKKEKGAIREFNKYIIFIGLIIIIIGSIILFLFSKYLVLILSDVKYISGAWMLAPMFFSFSLFLLSMSTTAEIFAYNKTKILLLPNIVSGIVSIFSFIILVKYFAINGAVLAFIISYLSYSIITFILVYRFKL
jgi:O-antigen/teichoic acid export membrane protein